MRCSASCMGVMPGSEAGATHLWDAVAEGEEDGPLSSLYSLAVFAASFSPSTSRRVPLSRDAHLTVGLKVGGAARPWGPGRFVTALPGPAASPLAELEVMQDLLQWLAASLHFKMRRLEPPPASLQPGLQAGLHGKPVRLSVGGEGSSSSSLSSSGRGWWDPGMDADTQ